MIICICSCIKMYRNFYAYTYSTIRTCTRLQALCHSFVCRLVFLCIHRHVRIWTLFIASPVRWLNAPSIQMHPDVAVSIERKVILVQTDWKDWIAWQFFKQWSCCHLRNAANSSYCMGFKLANYTLQSFIMWVPLRYMSRNGFVRRWHVFYTGTAHLVHLVIYYSCTCTAQIVSFC